MNKKNLSPASFIGIRNNHIISFGSGEPDLPPPNEVYTALSSYTNFKYGLIQGQENLRASLTEQYPKSTENSFVITNGASEALDLTLRVIAKYESSLSKKVLITKPFYYSYPKIIEYICVCLRIGVWMDRCGNSINMNDSHQICFRICYRISVHQLM